MSNIISQLVPCEVTSLDAPGWTWNFIETTEDEDIFLAKVVSPLCPEGEFGSVSFSELNNNFTLMVNTNS